MAQPKRYLAIGFALMGFLCMAFGAMLLSPIPVEAQDDAVTTSRRHNVQWRICQHQGL